MSKASTPVAEMTYLKLEKRGRMYGQLSEVISTHVECNNIKKQVCGSTKVRTKDEQLPFDEKGMKELKKKVNNRAGNS